MNCTDFEILVADYLDGSLSASERKAIDEHAAACAGCRVLLADASSGLAILSRAEPVDAPDELITRIAFQAPVGRTRQPFERETLVSRLFSKWVQPILQPRLAMGMAMTILSFAMLERCTGVRVQQIQPADLNPVRIWGGVEDKALRVKDRAVKYYENLRWVYEIETTLRVLETQQDAQQSSKKATAEGVDRNNPERNNLQRNNPEQSGKPTPDRMEKQR
jgi:hypothetical protein